MAWEYMLYLTNINDIEIYAVPNQFNDIEIHAVPNQYK